MDDLYARTLRPWLFTFDAEEAHGLAVGALALAHRVPALRAALGALGSRDDDPALACALFGQRFRSPVCVAAGFDKGAEVYNALGALGFAAVEVGTVTPRPQEGNPRPRLFRLPDDLAVVNRMGFNNPGAEAVARRLRAHPPDGVVLGVNLGKGRATSLDDAPRDYADAARLLAPLAHYLVVNVSSPNTPGLRALQSVQHLADITRAVREVTDAPLLVKIAPDLADEDVDAVAALALAEGLDGLVATNTTLSRAGLRTPPDAVEAVGAGGLSGAPVRRRATEVIARLWRATGGRVPVVGVGGVFDVDDAWEKICAGASLVQVYTGMLYQGPTMARDLARGLSERLRAGGFASVREAVGSGPRVTAPRGGDTVPA